MRKWSGYFVLLSSLRDNELVRRIVYKITNAKLMVCYYILNLYICLDANNALSVALL